MTQLLVVGAWGAGRMGRGIAHTFAFAGHDVLLFDSKARDQAQNKNVQTQAMQEIADNLNHLVALHAVTPAQRDQTLSRIRFVSFELSSTELVKVDVLFEGVPEVLALKKEAFEYLSKQVRSDCLLASTTSTMLSTQLAEFVIKPERFLNAHWLNPAYLIPLVEVSAHPGTSPIATEKLKILLEHIGKKPVFCQPAPGFIVPRLQSLVMNEAARMIEQGVATAKDIDAAIRYGFGPRYAAMGVMEFIDVGGLDILYYASQYLSKALEDDRYAAPNIVNEYMLAGKKGLKTGRGFFDYAGVDVPAYRQQIMQRQVALLDQLALMPRFDSAATSH
jgi:3-hydroxybutyryl-CoA dehydrogenase